MEKLTLQSKASNVSRNFFPTWRTFNFSSLLLKKRPIFIPEPSQWSSWTDPLQFALKGKDKHHLGVFKLVGTPAVNLLWIFGSNHLKMICTHNQCCNKTLLNLTYICITTSKSRSLTGGGRLFWCSVFVGSWLPMFYGVKQPWNRKIKSLLVSNLIIFIACSCKKGIMSAMVVSFLRDVSQEDHKYGAITLAL